LAAFHLELLQATPVIDVLQSALLILQSLDWLAAFHLELLQVALVIVVLQSALVFLATPFKDVYYKLVMPNYMPYP
jgi:hypothetical protein